MDFLCTWVGEKKASWKNGKSSPIYSFSFWFEYLTYKVIAVMDKSKTSYFTIRDSFEREFDRFSDADASLAWRKSDLSNIGDGERSAASTLAPFLHLLQDYFHHISHET